MKLDSKYFDSIRIAPRKKRTPAEERHRCEWNGCTRAGLYRAPKGRGHEGEFHRFCFDHVRAYNASYDYFAGMAPEEIEKFQKEAMTGHRPTWRVGSGSPGIEGFGFGTGRPEAPPETWPRDPHRLFSRRFRRSPADGAEEDRPRRMLKPIERKSLDTLGLPDTAGRADIKARFKELVKCYHPDLNGGDHRSVDRLREIIQAYNYLKQAGLA